jgi:hypothetical protein
LASRAFCEMIPSCKAPSHREAADRTPLPSLVRSAIS